MITLFMFYHSSQWLMLGASPRLLPDFVLWTTSQMTMRNKAIFASHVIQNACSQTAKDKIIKKELV